MRSLWVRVSGILVVVLALSFSSFYFFSGDGTRIITPAGKKSENEKQKRLRDLFDQEFEMTKDPALGYVPSERLQQAYREMRERKETASFKKSAVAGANWTERGPDNIGGRTRALLWDPNTTNKVWAGGVTGGLWYNDDITNSNSTWTAVDDFWQDIAVTSIAYDPNNTQIMYVGTGEGYYTGSSRGQGIWKSTDGGSTWTQLQSTNAFDFVLDIIVRNEAGTSVIYAAVDGRYYRGSWGNYLNQGLQRSTDGGLTWTQVLPHHQKVDGSGNTHPFTPADIELAADNRIWIGTMNNPWGNGGGSILWSDDGTTWSVDSTSYGTIANVGRVELACAPSDANVVYGLIEANQVLERVIYTNNKGATWTDKNEPNDADFGIPSSDMTRGQAWYDLIIQVDPNDPNVAITGGIDLFRTTDAATNWTQISIWAYGAFFGIPEVHADQHQIMYKPGSSSEVIFGNDGGVWYTSTGNTNSPSFVNMNNGYNVTQFYAAAIHPDAGSNYFLAGAQDNGTQKFTVAGMNTTTQATGGDGAYTHIDQDEPQFQYTSYVYNSFYVSTDGGGSFTNVEPAVTDSGAYFINPSDFDDTQNLFYSSNGKGHYLRWEDPHTTTGTFTNVAMPALAGDEVTAITASPFTANRVFFGSNNGKIIRADNAHTNSPTATVLNSGAGMPASWVNCIAIDPASENHMLAIYSNFGVSSVWETTDGGTTWTDCEGDLPDMPVRWALINPDNSKQVLLATEMGIWSTDYINGADTRWVPANTGQANVRTDMLKMRSSDNLIIAATYGRGLYSSDVFATAAAGFSVDTDVAYIGQTVKFFDGSVKATSWSWDFGDGTTSTQQSPTHSYSTAGTYTVSLTINGGASTDTQTNLIHVLPNLGTPFTPSAGGDFESNTSYFDSRSTNGLLDVWELGAPGNALTTVNSGTNVWKTRLTKDVDLGNYTSVLYSPNFNFTAAGSYSVHFRKSMEASGSNAPFGVYMEYSTDNGATWSRLGTDNDPNGTNWYDRGPSSAVSHSVTPGGYAWSGNYDNEATSYDCSFLAGNSSVAFRFVFMMARGYTDGYNQDGFMVEDFEIQGQTNDVSLPVELSAFKAEPAAGGKGIQLKWRTESELENALWKIERSVDDGDFELIETIRGQGTVNSGTDYSYLDQNVSYGHRYSYRLSDVAYNGAVNLSSVISVDFLAPAEFRLAQNYPNPFNPSTKIEYDLPENSSVRLDIYDASGRHVRQLVKGEQAAGTYTVSWDGRNALGQTVASGMYIYRLTAGKYNSIKKMILMR